MAEAREQLEAIIAKPESSGIYWAELASEQNNGGWRSGNRALSLHAAPLHVGPLVEKHLFKKKACVVMTSATLRTGGNFTLSRSVCTPGMRMSWRSARRSTGSRSTLLYLVSDVPEPGEQGYQRALEQGLISLCRAMGGRTMVLFTSYSQLRTTAKAINPALAKDDITVYEQSDGSSRRQCWRISRTRSAACCWARARSGRAWTCPARRFRVWRSCVCLLPSRLIRSLPRAVRRSSRRSPNIRCRTPFCVFARALAASSARPPTGASSSCSTSG